MSKPADAKAVFQEVRELPAAEQAAYLDAACGGDAALRARVEALLAADEQAGQFLASPTGGGSDDSAPHEQPGTVIGHFKLQQEIGEGGFGTVWMAEQQQPVRRQVALKVVKRGMDTRSVVARFEQERQALAMMDHPNIAKVFDGGETPAGRPYFAMELVRGVPITTFCDQQHLDAKERLGLFVLVCQAVQHAHQKGIIHRDLKPSNVLVTLHDGVPVPKVIDFGVAKAVHRPLTEKTLFTEFQQMVGTPEYMSPEQAELSGLDIDTRADIYSLGVLLYELLTGTLPFDAGTLQQKGLLEMLRVIREDEPPKPSTRVSTPGESSMEVARSRRTDTRRLGKLLRGDLDWIVMKALEKDRARRYVSADALAADVQRHLRDEPVLASPPGRVYRLRKYVRRHRVGVGAGAAVVVALLCGLSLAVWGFLDAVAQAERAEASERAAKKEARRANTVLDFVDQALSSADPAHTKGPEYKVRELLDDFDRALGKRFESEPEIDASLHRLLGNGFVGLGSYDKAEPHLTQALAIHERAIAGDPFACAVSLQDKAQLLYLRGQYADSLELLDRGETLLKEPARPPCIALARILRCRSTLNGALGRLDRAETDANEALAITKNLVGEGAHLETAKCIQILAKALLARGNVEEAVQLQDLSLAQLRELPDVDSLEVALAKNAFAEALLEHGNFELAEKLCRESLKELQVRIGDDHSRIAEFRSDLGEVLARGAKLPEAEQEVLEALTTLRKLHRSDEHPETLATNMKLAGILAEAGRLTEAERLMRSVLAAQERLWGIGNPRLGSSLHSMAQVLGGRGRYVEAEEAARAAVRAARETYGKVSFHVARALNTLGQALKATRKLDEAVRVAQESLDMKRQIFGPCHPDVANGLNNLALVLLQLERYPEAESRAREALAMQEQVRGPKHTNVAKTMSSVASALQGQRRFAEAEGYLKKALALATEIHAAHTLVSDYLNDLGTLFQEQEKWGEAEQYHKQALEVTRAAYGMDHPYLATSVGHLASVVAAQGRFDEAAKLARDALQLRLRLPEQDIQAITTAYWNLAQLLFRARKGPEALVVSREHVDYLRAKTPAGSPEFGRALHCLGGAYFLVSDFAAAEAAWRECEAIEVRVAPGSRIHCSAVSMRGHTLSQLGRYEEADRLLRESRDRWLALKKPDLGHRVTLERLIANCERWQKPEAAAEWRKVLAAEFPTTGK